MRMITASSPVRLQLLIPRLLILDQTWSVLPKLNLPQVQQGT